MKSRLMTSKYTQNGVASCVRNVYSVLRIHLYNGNYISFNNAESLKYIVKLWIYRDSINVYQFDIMTIGSSGKMIH
jgi:hypothetical protein